MKERKVRDLVTQYRVTAFTKQGAIMLLDALPKLIKKQLFDCWKLEKRPVDPKSFTRLLLSYFFISHDGRVYIPNDALFYTSSRMEEEGGISPFGEIHFVEKSVQGAGQSGFQLDQTDVYNLIQNLEALLILNNKQCKPDPNIILSRPPVNVLSHDGVKKLLLDEQGFSEADLLFHYADNINRWEAELRSFLNKVKKLIAGLDKYILCDFGHSNVISYYNGHFFWWTQYGTCRKVTIVFTN